METVCDYSINLQRRATRMAVPYARCQNCFATWPLLSQSLPILSLHTRLVLRGTAEARNYTHDLYSQDPQEYDTMVVSV